MPDSRLVGRLVTLYTESGINERGLILEVDKSLTAMVKLQRISRPDKVIADVPYMSSPPKTQVIGRKEVRIVGWYAPAK